MKIVVWKQQRLLSLWDEEDSPLFTVRVALGSHPTGPKRCQGDGKTPEGRFFLCIAKEHGKYGKSLGLSYPAPEDARLALAEGRINPSTYQAVVDAHQQGRRPPWGTPLGGEIYLHGGGTHRDWTAGCIALEDADMDRLFAFRASISQVEILPE